MSEKGGDNKREQRWKNGTAVQEFRERKGHWVEGRGRQGSEAQRMVVEAGGRGI